MSSMIIGACYLHNFCIDSSYVWAGQEDIFSPSALTQLRSEFVEALQQASGAMVGSDTVSTAMPAASDSDEDVTEDDGVMGDASSVPVRDEIAHLGWRKYQEALKARDSSASREEERYIQYQPVHEAAHSLAAGAPLAQTNL